LKKVKKKQLFISIGIILLIFIGIIVIWWYYPVTRIDTNQLTPQNVSLSIRCLTDSHHQLRQTGIQLVSRSVRQQLTGLKGTLVRFGISKAFPEEIRIATNQNPETKENITITVVDFGPGIKLVHLVQQSITRNLLRGSPILDKQVGQYTIHYILRPSKKGSSQPQACAWIDSGLIISNDLTLLTDLVSGYRSGLAIGIPAGQPDGIFSISNKNHEITERFKEQEKNLKYAISPTIDLIDHVEGALTMQDADKGGGKMNLYLTNTITQEQLAVVESNMEFLKEELRKLVRAQGKELTATISMQDNILVIDYQIAGLSR
jgi:hypothetical protein